MDKEVRQLLYGELKKLIVRKVMLTVFGKVIGGWRLIVLNFVIDKVFPAVVISLEFLRRKGVVIIHKKKVKKQMEKMHDAKTMAEFDAAFDDLN